MYILLSPNILPGPELSLVVGSISFSSLCLAFLFFLRVAYCSYVDGALYGVEWSLSVATLWSCLHTPGARILTDFPPLVLGTDEGLRILSPFWILLSLGVVSSRSLPSLLEFTHSHLLMSPTALLDWRASLDVYLCLGLIFGKEVVGGSPGNFTFPWPSL